MVSGPQFQRDEQVGTARGRPADESVHATPPASPLVLQLQRLAGNRAVAELVLQRNCVPGHKGPKKSRGVSMNIESAPWAASGMATDLRLAYLGTPGNEGHFELGSTSSNKSVLHGAEHAEDVAIRAITDNITMFDPAARNKLWLAITKSPCTSVARAGLPITSTKAVGCAERLIDLVTNGITVAGVTYNFDLVVDVRGLYAPPVGGATQQQVLDASQAALDALAATGHVTVTGDVRTGASARFGAK